MVKRQKVEGREGGGAGASTSSSQGRWIGIVDGQVRPCFSELAALCQGKVEGGGGNEEGDFEPRVQDVRSRLSKGVRDLVEELDVRKAEGKRGEVAALESELGKVFRELQAFVRDSGTQLDGMKRKQLEFLRNETKGMQEWRQLLAFAHRLSFTTFAPPKYAPGDPRWGVVGPFMQPVGNSTGFWHFSPPAPQKWHMDASVLHNEAVQKEPKKEEDEEEAARKTKVESDLTPKPEPTAPLANGAPKEAEAAKDEPLASAAAGEEEEVDGKRARPEEPKTEAYNPALSNMVDFVLNPDLIVHEDFVSDDEEMSESSD